MKTKISYVWLTVAALTLSGCGTLGVWEWNVTRFHNIENVRETTFTIVPLRTENNDSLEFKAYATLVAAKLGHYGMIYKSREEFGKTDYIVGLDYGIGEPYQVNYSYPIYGPIGGGMQYVSGTVYAGGKSANYSGQVSTPMTLGVVGSSSGSLTNYRQYVRIFIFDGKNEGGHFVKRYEGKAEGAGYLNDLTKIVPSGLKALLMEFPGESGKSKTETFRGLDETP